MLEVVLGSTQAVVNMAQSPSPSREAVEQQRQTSVTSLPSMAVVLSQHCCPSKEGLRVTYILYDRPLYTSPRTFSGLGW